jgi:hypothetical protein
VRRRKWPDLEVGEFEGLPGPDMPDGRELPEMPLLRLVRPRGEIDRYPVTPRENARAPDVIGVLVGDQDRSQVADVGADAAMRRSLPRRSGRSTRTQVPPASTGRNCRRCRWRERGSSRRGRFARKDAGRAQAANARTGTDALSEPSLFRVSSRSPDRSRQFDARERRGSAREPLEHLLHDPRRSRQNRLVAGFVDFW